MGSARECSDCTIRSLNLGMMWKGNIVPVLCIIPMLTSLYNQSIILHPSDALAVVIEVANHANDIMKQGVSILTYEAG